MDTSYNKISTMDYKVQNVLPQAYFDSLSYQEVLYKVVAFLNQVVDLTNLTKEEVDELYEFIHNSGLSEIINQTLDEWYASGKLGEIINTVLLGEINARIADDEVYDRESTGYGVVTGLVVKAQENPDMSVLVTAGIAHTYAGRRYIQGQDQRIAISPANGTFARWDVVYISPVGQLMYLAGQPSATPVKPTVSDGSIILGYVFVNSIVTIIIQGNVEVVDSKKYSLMELEALFKEIRNDVNDNKDAIEAEAIDRQLADNALQVNIDGEATAREEADNALQVNIDGEATAREEADNALQVNIDGEAIARQQADNALQDNIDSETIAREEADNLILQKISAKTVNVDDYGAIGNGIADDTVAIQTAINEMTHGIINFSGDKTYLISGVSITAKQKISFKGNGCKIIMNAPSKDGFLVYESDYIIFDNFEITSNYTKDTFAITFISCRYFTVSNCNIHEMGKINVANPTTDAEWGGFGIFIRNVPTEIGARHPSATREMFGGLIEKCTIKNIAGAGSMSGDGILIASYNTAFSVHDITIRDCDISNCGRVHISLNGTKASIYPIPYNITIENNTFTNSALWSVDCEDGENVIIKDNFFTACGNWQGYINPLSVWGADLLMAVGITGGSSKVYIDNNIIKNCYNGIKGGYNGEVQILNNKITDCTAFGIAINGELTLDYQHIIKNNIIVNCGQQELWVYEAENVIIDGNVIIDKGTTLNSVVLWGLKNAKFINNMCVGGIGVEIKNPIFNTIKNNTIKNASGKGINVQCDGGFTYHNNIISDNTFIDTLTPHVMIRGLNFAGNFLLNDIVVTGNTFDGVTYPICELSSAISGATIVLENNTNLPDTLTTWVGTNSLVLLTDNLANVGNTFKLSGVYDINTIQVNYKGRKIDIIANGGAGKLTSGGNLKLVADFLFTPVDSRITLISDGTSWYELSRITVE